MLCRHFYLDDCCDKSLSEEGQIMLGLLRLGKARRRDSCLEDGQSKLA
jgi:hypothetical protein